MSTWTPRRGDLCVDLRSSGNSWDPDRCGEEVTVKTVTETLVITSDGERYSRAHLTPISEGRYSSRKLVPAGDDRVLCVRGRTALRQVAQLANNLVGIDHKDPMAYVGALAEISRAAVEARADFLKTTAQKGGKA